MKIIATATLAVALLVPLAASSGPPNIIHERQELMENMKDNALRPLVGMARGEVPFDADAVAAGLEIMAEVADKAGDMFPEGSETGHDTEALPEIWTDRDGFNEALANFDSAVDKAQHAAPDSVEALKPVLMGIIETCKGCHDNYRVEQE